MEKCKFGNRNQSNLSECYRGPNSITVVSNSHRPDRIRMMVCKITQAEDVDAFCFDFTRTLDENTSIRSMFQVVEEIKNGHIVLAMFGTPMESIIPNPFVIIFTNEDIWGYYRYLSKDRWQVYAIIENELLAVTKFEPHDQNNRFIKLSSKRR